MERDGRDCFYVAFLHLHFIICLAIPTEQSACNIEYFMPTENEHAGHARYLMDSVRYLNYIIVLLSQNLFFMITRYPIDFALMTRMLLGYFMCLHRKNMNHVDRYDICLSSLSLPVNTIT